MGAFSDLPAVCQPPSYLTPWPPHRSPLLLILELISQNRPSLQCGAQMIYGLRTTWNGGSCWSGPPSSCHQPSRTFPNHLF